MKGSDPAARLAYDLRRELEHLNIRSTVSSGYGMALLQVGVLTVWCEFGSESWRYRWWDGDTTDAGHRRYSYCPASATDTAARRIARFCLEMQP